jgi:hypothetical protein
LSARRCSRHFIPHPSYFLPLFATAGFVVNRYIKSCKPTLTVESALRLADEQKLGSVRCFLEGKTRREGKARRLFVVNALASDRFQLLTQLCHVPAGSNVGEPDFVGEGGDEFVTAGGEFGGDTAFALIETGEDQQATIC